MRIIPVLDLAGGRAVHARGGQRAGYLPVRSVLAPDAPGAALPLARSFRTRLGAQECYVADLDAIEGRAPQLELLTRLADPVEGFGRGLMVDAGSSDVAAVRSVLRTGAGAVVVGLETLGPGAELTRIVQAAGPDRIGFSLDLRDGQPVLRPGSPFVGAPLTEIVEVAERAGMKRIIVLDLVRVGSRSGLDLGLIRALRRGFPSIRLLVGGGIRGVEDLRGLQASGCEAALVGTALHDGTLGFAEWRD